MTGNVTWFYKVCIGAYGSTVFQLWTVEGEGYLQSGASMRVEYLLNDRYWDGL